MTGSKPGWKSVSCMPTWSFLPWRGRCCSAFRFLDWACIVWSDWKSTQCNQHTSWGNLMHLSPMLSLGMMVWSNDLFLMNGCIRFHADIPLSCGCMYWRGKLHSRKNRGSLWTLQVSSYLLLESQSMSPYFSFYSLIESIFEKFWLGTIELWMHVLRIDDSDFKDSLYCSLLFWHPLSGLFVRISCTFWCGTNRRYFNQRNNTRCRRRVEVTGNKVSNICK